jgi:acyl carrier protein phosphodiesterase
MISDHVKGKKRYDYPDSVQKGIILHRMIDRYTDEHPATQEAKQVFRPVYRLYSGAIVDVVYDHFLAIDENEFTEDSLLEFSLDVYEKLERQRKWFPPRFDMMFPYMKEHNWLYNYRLVSGTEKSLGGLVRRAAYLNDSKPAFELFKQHYQLLKDLYRQCWTGLKPYTLNQFNILQSIADS